MAAVPAGTIQTMKAQTRPANTNSCGICSIKTGTTTLSHAGTLVTIGMTGVSNVCALLAPKLTGDYDLGHIKFAIVGCLRLANVAARGGEVAPRPEMPPPVRLRKSGNSICTRWDELPLTRRTTSPTAICGWISTNIWTCSRDNMPETICTPSSLQTCRIIVRIRSRNAPSRTL
jgi:hypothetical protein